MPHLVQLPQLKPFIRSLFSFLTSLLCVLCSIDLLWFLLINGSRFWQEKTVDPTLLTGDESKRGWPRGLAQGGWKLFTYYILYYYSFLYQPQRRFWKEVFFSSFIFCWCIIIYYIFRRPHTTPLHKLDDMSSRPSSSSSTYCVPVNLARWTIATWKLGGSPLSPINIYGPRERESYVRHALTCKYSTIHFFIVKIGLEGILEIVWTLCLIQCWFIPIQQLHNGNRRRRASASTSPRPFVSPLNTHSSSRELSQMPCRTNYILDAELSYIQEKKKSAVAIYNKFFQLLIALLFSGDCDGGLCCCARACIELTIWMARGAERFDNCRLLNLFFFFFIILNCCCCTWRLNTFSI